MRRLVLAALQDAGRFVVGVGEDLVTLAFLLGRTAVVPRQCCRTFQGEPHGGRCVTAGRVRP